MDTIISWRDPEYATELALRFQEPSGCSYIWDHICNVQRNMHFNTLNSEPFHSVNSELRELPVVELSTRPLILKTVVGSGIADQLRLTKLILSDQEFFRKLMEVFKVCEDLENMDGLHMIFKIVKGISQYSFLRHFDLDPYVVIYVFIHSCDVCSLAVLLNSPPIFERIFSDEFIVDIIGALEYDPEVNRVQNRRIFLKEHVVFKDAIHIKDPLVFVEHQTYRVGFLKVVSLLKDDNTFIQELFARLKLPTTSLESKKNLVIGETNCADVLDPALMCSGRLDRKIEFPHPIEEARA